MPQSLDDELTEMTALFGSAAAVAGQELGLEAATDTDRARLRGWSRMPGISEDVRMMVPVLYDRGRGKTKVWAMVGWTTRRLRVSFVTPPAVHVLEGRPKIEFSAGYYTLAVPIFAEAYVARLLDRDEFRAHCDRYATRTSILQHL